MAGVSRESSSDHSESLIRVHVYHNLNDEALATCDCHRHAHRQTLLF